MMLIYYRTKQPICQLLIRYVYYFTKLQHQSQRVFYMNWNEQNSIIVIWHVKNIYPSQICFFYTFSTYEKYHIQKIRKTHNIKYTPTYTTIQIVLIFYLCCMTCSYNTQKYDILLTYIMKTILLNEMLSSFQIDIKKKWTQ